MQTFFKVSLPTSTIYFSNKIIFPCNHWRSSLNNFASSWTVAKQTDEFTYHAFTQKRQPQSSHSQNWLYIYRRCYPGGVVCTRTILALSMCSLVYHAWVLTSHFSFLTSENRSYREGSLSSLISIVFSIRVCKNNNKKNRLTSFWVLVWYWLLFLRVFMFACLVICIPSCPSLREHVKFR